MRCDDVLLELQSPTMSEAVRAHLERCADCQLAAKALVLAALPPVSPAERMGLEGLANATQTRWLLLEHHRIERAGRFGQLTRLALAAGVGALLATGVHAWQKPLAVTAPSARALAIQPVALEAPVLSEFELELDEPNLSDDEVFFEVSWPQPTEGDL